MKIRAILETETMDPDFKESFLNGMPFDITESTFDRIVRYASGCTDVQQPDVIAMVIQHSLDNRKELSELLNTCNHTTQMRVLIPVLAEELPAEPYIPLNQQIKSEED